MEGLFVKGVILVMILNYLLDWFYLNGLYWESFLLIIVLFNKYFDVYEVDFGVDYCLWVLEQVEIFYYLVDVVVEKKMCEYFCMVVGEEGKKGGFVEIFGWKVDIVCCGYGVIWFDFKMLCGGFCLQNDYLEIVCSYYMVLFLYILMMIQYQVLEVWCFIWLVDVFYDYKVKLIVMVDCVLEVFYIEGMQVSEFVWMVSCLIEMYLVEYFGLLYFVVV